jgi:hypothetical protein
MLRWGARPKLSRAALCSGFCKKCIIFTLKQYAIRWAWVVDVESNVLAIEPSPLCLLPTEPSTPGRQGVKDLLLT